MAKSAKRKTKTATQAKNKVKTVKKGRAKTVEYVDYLLKLHKLQGGLLNQLSKEIS